MAPNDSHRVSLLLNHYPKAMMPVLINVLNALESAADDFLRRHMSWVLPSLCDLIRCRRPEVAAVLHRVMMTKLTPLLVHGDKLGS